MVKVIIEKATEADLSEIKELLNGSNLPVDGVDEMILKSVVGKLNGEVKGVAGLELYNKKALLRSVAVDRKFQGNGVGILLTEAAIDLAGKEGVNNLFLLTETAEKFFSKFGFKRIDRNETPAEIQSTKEFSSICPSSAIVMKLTLSENKDSL